MGGSTHRVLAIAAGSPTAFFLGNLHQALLSATANGVPVARALLHGNRRNHDGGDASLSAIPLEQIKVGLAVVEGTVGLGESLIERLVDDVLKGNLGRVPSSALDTTVKEVDVSIRSAELGRLG